MPSYSDSEMRAIMGRALQIDSGRSERFTPEQLRTIAAELGISTQALEVAMYEADAGARGLNTQQAPPPKPRSFGAAAALLVVVIVAAVAVASFMFVRVTPQRLPAPTRTPAPTPAAEAAPAAPAPARAVPIQPTPSSADLKKTTKKKQQ